MDGRDIGTVVLPDAQVKIYLTASVETRAKRRYDEYLAKGESADLEEIKKDIETGSSGYDKRNFSSSPG